MQSLSKGHSKPISSHVFLLGITSHCVFSYTTITPPQYLSQRMMQVEHGGARLTTQPPREDDSLRGTWCCRFCCQLATTRDWATNTVNILYFSLWSCLIVTLIACQQQGDDILLITQSCSLIFCGMLPMKEYFNLQYSFKVSMQWSFAGLYKYVWHIALQAQTNKTILHSK